MSNVIKFKIKEKLKTKSFLQSNETIENIYFELAEYTLITFYKIFPFSSAFEGFEQDDPNEQFKNCVILWADFFKSHQIESYDKVKEVIKKLVSRGRFMPPSLAEFLCAYKNDDMEKFNHNELVQYALYIQSMHTFDKNNPQKGLFIKDALSFDDWREKISGLDKIEFL